MLKLQNAILLNTKLNKILNDKNSNELITAINSLHIIKLHNDYLKNQKFFYKNIFILIIQFFYNCAFGTIKWIFRLLENYYFFIVNTKTFFDKKKDIIFISFIQNLNFNRSKNDFIYGKIFPFIKSKYKNTKILYLNLTTINSIKLSNHYKNKLYIFDNILFIKDEIIILYLQFLQLKIFFFDFLLKRKISLVFYIRIIISIFTYQTKNNLRYLYQFKNLFLTNKIQVAFSTFEGHAWEKLFFFSSKLNKYKTRVFAYQHLGILGSKQMWIKKFNFNKFSPDLILTCGNINKKKLIKYNKVFMNKVKVIGTYKHIKRNFKKTNKILKDIYCLVCPEGTITETKFLFKYAFDIARIRPDIKFILRAHPLLEINNFINKYFDKDSVNSLSNVELSENDFEHDLNKSNVILFRGSYSVISGLLHHLIPVYYNGVKNDFDINPIQDSNIKTFKVKTINNFVDLLNNKSFLKYKSYNSGKIYAKNFFTSYNKKKIINLI
jgi:hypothetical protein